MFPFVFPSLFVFLATVNLLDSKASQGELGWISYPSHGVSILSHSVYPHHVRMLTFWRRIRRCECRVWIQTHDTWNGDFQNSCGSHCVMLTRWAKCRLTHFSFDIFLHSASQVIGRAFRACHMVKMLKGNVVRVCPGVYRKIKALKGLWAGGTKASTYTNSDKLSPF